ncbi:MAG: Ku protein, partial [Stellaceae bacterium]
MSCPVHLTPVTTAGKRVRLDDVNARTGNLVTEQFVDSKTGDVVAAGAVAKGYRVDSARHVIVSDEELKALTGAAANVLDIEQFVPHDQIDRIYVDASCYVHPEGQIATETVHALSLAMERDGRVGLGRVSLGDRERTVMVQPHGTGLMMSTLHSPDQIVLPGFAERPADQIPVEMVEVAETIISRRSRDFSPSLLQDRTEAALRALVEQKVRSAPPPPPASPPRPSPAPAAPPPPAAAASPSPASESRPSASSAASPSPSATPSAPPPSATASSAVASPSTSPASSSPSASSRAAAALSSPSAAPS